MDEFGLLKSAIVVSCKDIDDWVAEYVDSDDAANRSTDVGVDAEAGVLMKRRSKLESVRTVVSKFWNQG